MTESDTKAESTKPREVDDAKGGGLFGKGLTGAIEKAVTAILFGAVMASAGYLYNKFSTIEQSIEKHHGAGWENRIGDIVEVKMLNDKLHQLETNTQELKELNERLNRAQKIFRNWGAQLDRQKRAESEKLVKGYANLNNRLPKEENACTINKAHPDGYRYRLGDMIQVSYTVSGVEQVLGCTVETLMDQANIANIIVQINKRMADQFDYFYETGIIEVTLTKPAPNPGDEDYWSPLPEVKELDLQVRAN